MLGDSDEQGRLFGLQEGLRGILNALLVFVMAGVYASFADNIIGAAWSIRLCAVLLLIIGVLCWFFIENTNTKEQSETLKDVFVGMFRCMKIPRVWLLVGNCVHRVQHLRTDELQSILIWSPCTACQRTMAANLGGIRYLLQGVGGIVGGFLADKIHSRLKVICGSGAILAISWAAFIAIPVDTAYYMAVLLNFFLGVILVYAIRSLYFADIDDAGIDVNVTGRVSGILSHLWLSAGRIYAFYGGSLDRHLCRKSRVQQSIYLRGGYGSAVYDYLRCADCCGETG